MSAKHGAQKDSDEHGGMGVDTSKELTRQWMQAWAEHPQERRKYGVFYTPDVIANRVIAIALEMLGRAPARVLEPSCGTGAFVRAFTRAASSQWDWTRADVADRVVGVELDPVAADIAAEATGATIVNADFLGDWPAKSDVRGFDLIIGNPPFGGAIRKDTGRDDEEKRRLRERFPLSAVGAYDRSALFIERALELLSDDGVLALVLPRALLASPSAMALRNELAQRGAPSVIEIDASDLFESADVHVCALIIGGTSAPDTARIYKAEPESSAYQVQPFSNELTSWSPLVEGTAAFVLSGSGFPTLGSFLEISASAATGEAYEWAPSVSEAECESADSDHEQREVGGGGDRDVQQDGAGRADAAHGFADRNHERSRLVISGSIDPFENRWGSRPSRYLGQVYERPVIAHEALSERRMEQALSPKVLMPGLSRCLEAMVDPDGIYVGAVATQTIRLRARQRDGHREGQRTSEVQLLRIAAILNSAWCRLQYRARYASTALSGGNIAVSRNKLEGITVLPEWQDWLLLEPAPRVVDSDRTTAGCERASKWSASVEHRLADVGMRGGLYKDVCTPAQFGLLAVVARRLAKSLTMNERKEALDGCLMRGPRDHLDSGVIDALLLSIAEKSMEFVAPIDLAVE